jgi:hypothetical protein
MLNSSHRVHRTAAARALPVSRSARRARPWHRFARASALLALAALGGCATIDPFAQAPISAHLQRTDAVGDCARALQARSRDVGAAGAQDAQDRVVAGFPYLRVDRLGEALAPAPADVVPGFSPGAGADVSAGTGRWNAWRGRLAELARQAEAIESRNSGLAPGAAGGEDDVAARCRKLLLDADAGPEARGALLQAARVPDDYSTGLRALGLYPLTRLAFAAGIRDWQQRTRADFAIPLPALPVEGRLQRLVPAADAAAELERVAGVPPAGLPAVSSAGSGAGTAAELRRLLLRHAPILEIDVTGEHDAVGPLAWRHGRVAVDAGAGPVAYVRLAHALMDGKPRRQLVYTFWFARRPKAHALDLLGGELDSLVWRVTLGDDGEALVYDSIHACGCYHLFFATDRVHPRSAPPADQGPLDEGLFMPQPALEDLAPEASAVVLRVQSRTHYLQRVYREPAATTAGVASVASASSIATGAQTASPVSPVSPVSPASPAASAYWLVDEDVLRSLPLPSPGTAGAAAAQLPTHRSAYDARGLVPGSERLERFLFWPMGIASAGQMRQWGRHATAFVGRRHFDDPWLLDRYFELARAASRPD